MSKAKEISREEFTQGIQQLGHLFTHKEIAFEFGVAPTTVKRWISGQTAAAPAARRVILERLSELKPVAQRHLSAERMKHLRELYDHREKAVVNEGSRGANFADACRGVVELLDEVERLRKRLPYVPGEKAEFRELPVGEFFGFDEGSDVDRPYSETYRVLVRTWDSCYRYEVEGWANAADIKSGAIFALDECEPVVRLEKNPNA